MNQQQDTHNQHKDGKVFHVMNQSFDTDSIGHISHDIYGGL